MLYQAVTAIADSQPNTLAISTTAGNRVTYRELCRRADRIASALTSRGIAAGHTVAGSLTNSIDYAALILATCRIGAVYVPISRDLDDDPRGWSLRRVNPALLVIEGNQPSVPTCPWVTRADLVNGAVGEVSERPPVTHAGLFRMLWTSGSTGRPRLVMWRQDKLLAERRQWLAHVGIRADDVVYCRHTLDVAHGMDIHLLAALLQGARLVLDDEHSTTDQLLDGLIDHRATVFSALPLHYQQLIRTARDRTGECRLNHLRLPLCGGAYLSGATVTDAARVLGIHIRRIYGSTEFGMALGNMDDVDQTLLGMRPIDGVEAVIAPLSARTPEIGELITRSAHTSNGYFDDAAKNAASFRDGWYHTGDVARLDADGQFHVLGRTAEAIEGVDGPVLAPELEAELARGCPVDEVVVLAAHTEDYRPEALVLAKPEADVDADRVCAAIDDILVAKSIHGQIRLTERIPHIPVGKPDKNLIRRQW